MNYEMLGDVIQVVRSSQSAVRSYSPEEMMRLSAVMREYQGGSWYKDYSWTGLVDKDYTKKNFVNDVKLLNQAGSFPVRKEINLAWLKITEKQTSLDQKDIYSLEYFDVDTIPVQDYFFTIEREADPFNYLKYLALHICAINLSETKKYVFPSSVKAVESVSEWPTRILRYRSAPDGFYYLPNTTEHRATYAEYCKRFREVAGTYYLAEALKVLDFSKIEDEAALKKAFSTYVNKIVPGLFSAINREYPVTISSADGKVLYTVKASIPNDKESGPAVEYEGLSSMSAREALRHEWEGAVSYIEMNLPKMGAAIARIEDPNAVIGGTAYSTDPLQNPFLVYNQVESISSGKLTFQNLALSSAKSKTPVLVTPEESQGLPALEYYKQAQSVRDRFTRGTFLEEGGMVSDQDIGGTPKKSTLLPWIIGGLAAAALASQVM